MRILILEDDSLRSVHFLRSLIGHVVEIVDTAEKAIQKLDQESWDLVSLDHDLGGDVMVDSGPGTGWEVAKWLSEHPEKKPPSIVIHSFNPPGRDAMKALLPEAVVAPGWWNPNA